MRKQNRFLGIKGKVLLPTDGAKFEFHLPLIIFEENTVTVCFCPALNITGYGHSENEAMDNYRYVLTEYLDITFKKKTLMTDLKRLGWQVGKSLSKKMSPPKIEDLLEKNINFKRAVEKYDFKKISTNVQIPVYA